LIKLRKESTREINKNVGEERMRRRMRTRMEGEEDEEETYMKEMTVFVCPVPFLKYSENRRILTRV
jgi:hypothetical protein